MEQVLLIAQIVISLLLVGVILVQKTSSDGLSGIGGGGSGNPLVSARASANFLTKATAFLVTLFMVNSIILANLAGKHDKGSITHKLEHHKEHKENHLPIVPIED